MLKKSLIICFIFLGSFLFSNDKTLDLPFYRETDSFQVYCNEEDHPAAEDVLYDLDQYYKKCCNDFNYSPSTLDKIKLKIYPDIKTFHSMLNEKNLAQWKVARFSSEDRAISLVSPKNPGLIHTEETAMKSAKYALGYFFICEKYPKSSLKFSALGLAIHMAQVYSKDVLQQNLINSNGEIEMPSIFQIDQAMMKYKELPSRSYPVAAYVYMQFIITNWGWDKAIEVLENNSSLESILEVSQEEFQKMCIQNFVKIIINLRL